MKVLTEPVHQQRPWKEGSSMAANYDPPAFLGSVGGIDFWLTQKMGLRYITFRWEDNEGDFSGWGGNSIGHPPLSGLDPEALEFCRTLHLLHA